jgi:transcriptional regulator with GAF, ATPase, and Fis domain
MITMVDSDRLAQLFVALADTLVADFDAIDFLHTLTDASVEVLNVQAAGLMLADQRGTLQATASTGDIGALETFELEHGQGPCVDCFATGRPVANVGPDEARRRWPQFSRNAERAGYASVHALPLQLRGQVIGAINLYCAHRLQLESSELNIAQALADVATIGLLQESIIRDQSVLTEQLQTALNTRVLIEQAKGIIAERHTSTPAQAFTALRTHARDSGRHLSVVAAGVVDGTVDTTTWSEYIS